MFERVYGLSYFPCRLDVSRTHTHTPKHREREVEIERDRERWREHKGQDTKKSEKTEFRERQKGNGGHIARGAYECEFMSPAPCGRCGAD